MNVKSETSEELDHLGIKSVLLALVCQTQSEKESWNISRKSNLKVLFVFKELGAEVVCLKAFKTPFAWKGLTSSKLFCTERHQIRFQGTTPDLGPWRKWWQEINKLLALPFYHRRFAVWMKQIYERTLTLTPSSQLNLHPLLQTITYLETTLWSWPFKPLIGYFCFFKKN